MGEVSAIPAVLEDYGTWGQSLNGNLTKMASEVNDAVIAFNKAPQSPQFTSTIPTVGDDLGGYAAQNQVVDQWVGRVGQAFETLDHQGVPPQIYRANYQDFRYGRVTVPESAITDQVGGDPVKEAADADKGAKLAFEVQDAEKTGDDKRLRSLLSQLSGASGALSFAFFNQLGPDGTVKALTAIEEMKGEDPALYRKLLDDFDSALGKATQNPDWNPTFTAALLDPDNQIWKNLSPFTGDFELDLLRYGTYSEDFLTQAGDLLLFSDKVSVNEPDKGTVVFNALARNPDAAYDYLTGTYDDGSEDLPRVEFLLRHSEMDYNVPGENPALGHLIQAAGLSRTGSLDADMTLLQDIGSIDTSNEVPDSVRPAVLTLLERHIGEFANTPIPPAKSYTGGSFPWQQRLFMIAELDQGGDVVPGRVTALQHAAAVWLRTHLPAGSGPGPSGAWFAQAGNLEGLTLLPGVKANWNEYDLEEESMEFWKTAIDFGTGFLPEWAHELEDIPLNVVVAIGKSYLSGSPGEPQVKDLDLFQKSVAAMLPTITLITAARDPSMLPASLRGLPLSDPRVVEYLSAIVKAAAGTKNPDFSNYPDLHLTQADKNNADNWANAIARAKGSAYPYGSVPVDGVN